MAVNLSVNLSDEIRARLHERHRDGKPVIVVGGAPESIIDTTPLTAIDAARASIYNNHHPARAAAAVEAVNRVPDLSVADMLAAAAMMVVGALVGFSPMERRHTVMAGFVATVMADLQAREAEAKPAGAGSAK